MRKSSFIALAAAASVGLSGCGFHGLYGVSLPGGADLGNHPYDVTIYFDNVLDLVPQSAVKVNDVAVGRVEHVYLSTAKDPTDKAGHSGWTAKVVISVRGDVKLPSNARAEIQQTSLLGEKYVALEEPVNTPASNFLHNHSIIGIDQTRSAPEVETVLGALALLLNDGGLIQLKTITSELGKALSGDNPAAVRDLIDQLNIFLGSLDKQKDQITTALTQVNNLAATLAKQTKVIAATLDTLPAALKILKDDRVKLVTLLTSLSHLGSVAGTIIDATGTTLTRALVNLSPTLEALTAAGSNLPKALRIAGTFPFPLGKTLEGVRGDYANLHLFLDLNLANELCGVNSALCVLGGALGASKTARQEKSGTTPVTTDTFGANPTLIGMGG